MKNLLGLVTLFACALLSSCAKPPSAPPMASVRVEAPQSAQLLKKNSYLAILESRQTVTLRPRITGLVQKILVRPGQQVAAGQTLMIIDADREQGALRQKEAEKQVAGASVESAKRKLDAIKAQKASAQSGLKLATSQFDRYSKLFAEELVSANVHEQYANELEQAKSKLASLEQDIAAQVSEVKRSEVSLTASDAQQSQAQAELGFFSITAPNAGLVGDIPVKLGDYVDEKSALVTVSDPSFLEVNFELPVSDLGGLAIGQSVQFSASELEEPVSAEVFFIAPNVDPASQSVLVKAVLNNQTGQYKVDQKGEVLFTVPVGEGFLVPVEAVSRFGNMSFVYLIEPKEKQTLARRKPVTVLGLQEGAYQVSTGLSAEDQLIVEGWEKLFGQDGLPVKILPPKAKK